MNFCGEIVFIAAALLNFLSLIVKFLISTLVCGEFLVGKVLHDAVRIISFIFTAIIMLIAIIFIIFLVFSLYAACLIICELVCMWVTVTLNSCISCFLFTKRIKCFLTLFVLLLGTARFQDILICPNTTIGWQDVSPTTSTNG